MLFMQFSRWEEEIVFEWTDAKPVRWAAGSLAQRVFNRLEDAPEKAAQRLTQWIQGHALPRRTLARISERTLALVHEQLRDWAERKSWWRERGVRWNGAYPSLAVEDAGPTDLLSTPEGVELVRQIEWRAPSFQDASELVCVKSPEAAVLLSALKGSLLGTLQPCLRCRRLFTLVGGERKRSSCRSCGALRAGRVHAVDEEYQRVYTRIRKRPSLSAEDRGKYHAQLAAVRDRARKEKWTAAEAIARLNAVAPRGRRGRRASKRGSS